MKKLLHIVPYFLPDVAFGGPVFSVSSLCEALAAEGNAVTVYTVGYDPAKTYPTREILNGVEVHYFKRDIGHPCQVSFQLWEALSQKATQFDLVHLHTWWNVLIFQSIRILAKRNIPMVASPRGMLSDYSFSHRKTFIKKYFQRLVGERLVEGIYLHGTSAAEANEMAFRTGHDLDEVFVMPNLLNLSPIAQHLPVEGEYSLGYLSRLHHKKGIELLLEAVARSPNVKKLVIGGRGEPAYEQHLKNLIDTLNIADRIEFAGWVTNEQKAEFFRRFQVFILPSYNENFANVVAEAWGAGKPVIVSNEVGLSEQVEAHDIGWVCQAQVDSIVQHIKRAEQEKALWPQMGNAAIRLVRMQFTDERIIRKYQDMYRQILDARQPRQQDLIAHVPSGDNYVLGINAHHADASAALFRNGVLVAAIEEERMRRIKHWAGFPTQAVEFCLQEAGIGWQDIGTVAFGRDEYAKWAEKLRFMLGHPQQLTRYMKGRLSNAAGGSSVERKLQRMAEQSGVSGIQKKLVKVEHHRSHLASAFFASGWNEAALLSVDGSGDFSTCMTGRGSGTQIEVLSSIDFPHSIGVFYTAITQLLGFPHYGDEYKVMGLAPYGAPKYLDLLRKILVLEEKGKFRLDLRYFRDPSRGYIHYDRNHIPVVPRLYSDEMAELFGAARKPTESITQWHKDLASSIQRLTEETLFHLLNYLHAQTGLERLCLAGGVAQNSVANGKITRNTPFRELYIPPAGHDAGLALGAGAYAYHHLQNNGRVGPILNAYTGSRFDNEEIERLLSRKNVPYMRLEDEELMPLVAQAIADGKVIGWFRGRSEFGPRALGNRSILADPRRADARELLNLKIKRRESFRPFAPSVLEEYASEYFEFAEPSPFMERVFQIKPEKRKLIPAVTHVDGSGRLQTVSKENNLDYFKLISTFMRLTGIPLLLNTSFNENEPIVNTPQQALDCFDRTEMDILVLEKLIVSR